MTKTPDLEPATGSLPLARIAAALLATALGWIWAGRATAGGWVAPALPEHLSETGLYQPGSTEVVRAEHLAFSPQYPLWSDGAHKRRWIQIPAGRFIDASVPDAWVFPVGTRLWKEFRFDRRVETRLIERLADGSWRYASYVWNAAGTDATLVPERGLRAAGQVRPGLAHDVPARGDCRLCHQRPGRPSPVLGFSALQLSGDRDPLAANAEVPPPGAVDLRALVERRLLRGLPRRWVDRAPRIEASSPVARAALGYLHANCSGCHNGLESIGAVDLPFEQTLVRPTDPGQASVLRATVDRPSVFRPAGLAGEAFRIVPGRPDASVLLFRVGSREPAVQMPPLGTRLIDAAGVALLKRWIEEMPAPPPALLSGRSSASSVR